MDEKLSIRVNIADRYYPLKIEKEDEEKIRKAAKLINDKVFQYKTKYADKDIQDFLAMAALQFVIRLIEMEEKQEGTSLLQKLQKLNDELEEIVANVNDSKTDVLLHTTD
ncbi:MAG TPA: cell division protein ZapA [Bacteroidales bacterium]|nr:cell division protein ZapA [Bacteroidales bacterium]